MKEFDLKAALNGKPVKLACGRKAYILYDLNRYHELLKYANRRPLNGLVMSDCKENDCYPTNWFSDGKNSFYQDNIIGMWEEPKKQISIEDLPKPFKPKDGEPFYYIYWGEIYCDYGYSERSSIYRSFSQNGQCFRTREDAQKWLDFMKGMME